MKYRGKSGEAFEVLTITNRNIHILSPIKENELALIWNTSANNKFIIDAKPYTFNKNQLLSLTEFNKLSFEKVNSFKFIRFNRGFYCVLHHDSEVSCKGILYYGSQQLPVINLESKEAEILETVWKMLEIEMESRDELQLEMLQMMLKRILILTTRAYKNQKGFTPLTNEKIDIIRDFNFLVEKHFTSKHSVADYAELMNKSPKTLSNSFKKLGNKTPLDLIKERILLEAHRKLSYTSEPISEIGYMLGFKDIQSFSRFFKKNEGISPSEFREKHQVGKN